MNLGQRLLELRKSKQLSQEEVAFKLNVTRQTVSKWETDQSTPDFDKIIPLCELYGITTEELLTGKKEDNISLKINEEETDYNNKGKMAKGIVFGVLLYFIAVAWMMVSIPVFMVNPVLSSAVFLLICGIATLIIVYTCIIYKKKNTKKKEKNPLLKQINKIIAVIILVIYLTVSFITFAWHITWIIWIIYAIIKEIVKLIFMLRGNYNEE